MKSNLYPILTRGFVVCAALTALACNKSSSNASSLPALSPDQVTRFSTTLDNVGRVGAVGAKLQQQNPNPSGKFAAVPPEEQESAKQSQMLAELQSDESAGACQVQTQLTPPPTPAEGQPPVQDYSYFIEISGAQCPITTDMKNHFTLTQTTTSEDLHYRMDLVYGINDTSLQQLNDITSMSLHGDMDLNITEQNSQVVIPITGGFSGTAHSLTDGDIKLSYAIGGQVVASQTDKGTGQYITKLRIDYKDMSAELDQITTMSNGAQNQAYTLNGVAISQQDAAAYLAKVSPMMIGLNGTTASSQVQLTQ